MKTSLKMKSLATALAVAGMTAVAGSALAESSTVTANFNTTGAVARHDFSIVIPAFLYFRVGPGAAFGAPADPAIGTITFTTTLANVGTGASIAGTGGDFDPDEATVAVRANRGQVTITEGNNSGGLGLGTGDGLDGYINYSEISTTATNASLPAPTLSNGGGGTSTPALGRDAGVGGLKVTERAGSWRYAYSNNTLPSAGTYGAGGGTGGRVTYTATSP